MRVVISSGHGKKIRGAEGPSPWGLDEVDEARRVVESVATALRSVGVDVTTYHDDVSDDQDENLQRICDFHNSRTRDWDFSVHFNSADFNGSNQTSDPVGSEMYYESQTGMEMADELVDAVCDASGLKNRGPKKGNLFFLSHTEEPAVLLEICFVNSKADCDIYRENYDLICNAIAQAISGEDLDIPAPIPPDPDLPEVPSDTHPTLAKGDVGPEVVQLQKILGIVPADGDFGSITDGGVRGFQAAAGLTVDGVVGQKTWDELDALDARKAAGSEGLPPDLVLDICELVTQSDIATYSWRDRGKMPFGYTQGVACCFALALMWLDEDDPAAVRMARADTNSPDTDALSWYRSEFQALGMYNNKAGIDTLRHLFVLLLGLGPRESSGRYCEGRDLSADNVSADTAEAGAWQTSWNIKAGDDAIEPLLEEFWSNPNGLLDVFQNGVEPDSNDLGNYGTGDGAKYQFLSKFAPAFHAMVTALGMRSLRQHWGPINNRAVEIKTEADGMLREVQQLVSDYVQPEPPEPPIGVVPTITISIDPPGSARVVIVGSA